MGQKKGDESPAILEKGDRNMASVEIYMISIKGGNKIICATRWIGVGKARVKKRKG